MIVATEVHCLKSAHKKTNIRETRRGHTPPKTNTDGKHQNSPFNLAPFNHISRGDHYHQIIWGPASSALPSTFESLRRQAAHKRPTKGPTRGPKPFARPAIPPAKATSTARRPMQTPRTHDGVALDVPPQPGDGSLLQKGYRQLSHRLWQ